MKNKIPKNFKHSERGNAALVAMVILGTIALTTLTLLASSTFRNTRNLDKGFLKVTEKWEARSQVNMLAAIISKDAPAQLETDVRFARERCSADFNLPIFDSDDPSGSPVSIPAVTFGDTTPQCASLTPSATSIFGKFDNWRDARLAVFKQTGVDRFNLNIDKVNIIEMTEIYRRKVSSGTSNDTAYAARYIVEAQFGNYRTRTNGEIILGSSIPGCGTTVAVEIVPATVERGNPVDMNIVFTYANSLQISDASGTIIHTETVTEQSSSQTFVYRFTPAVSGSYRVVATGSGSCSAQSALVPVTVTNPPAVCPRILNFSASSNTINAGEQVTISWNVADAADVKLEDVPVAFVGSQIFRLNATRTFTLTARDTANTCPVTQTITVNVNPTPACAFGTPQISDFSASQSSVAPGGSSTLAWNLTGLADGGTIRLTGNGLDQSVNSSGTQLITLPNAVGDYTYTLIAENICPDGTRLTAQRQVVISVRACPPPVINAFTVNPSSVTMGGNQLITLSWSISGTVDAVSISNGVGSALPASGSIDINQPQANTTYTITAVGCSQSVQSQVTVNVVQVPNPTCQSTSVGDDFSVAISYKYAPSGAYIFQFPYPKMKPILRWVAINAQPDSVRINGQPVPVKGEMLLQNISPGNFTYTITANNLTGTTTKTDSVNFTAYPANGAGSITVSPNPLVTGEPLTINDSSTGVRVINPGAIDYPSSDSFINQAYFGTVEKTGFWQFGSSQEPFFGTYDYLQTVLPAGSPQIKMFAASPYIVNQPGTAVRLNWSVENGSTVNIAEVGDVTGRSYIDVIAPPVDTLYHMTVTSPSGLTDTRTALLVVKQKGWSFFGSGSAGSGLASASFGGTVTTPENGNIQVNVSGSGVLVGGSPSNGGVSRIQIFNGDDVLYDAAPPLTAGPYGSVVYEFEVPAPACRKIIHFRVFFSVAYCPPFVGNCDVFSGILDSRFPNSYGPSYTENGFTIRSSGGQYVSTINSFNNPTSTAAGFYY